MAEVTSITRDLVWKIENSLGAIHNDLEVLDSGVGTVNDNVKVVYDEVGKLARDFYAFVSAQVRANSLARRRRAL